jgi:uncharacterized membrane protein YkvA (DUF1232 family)
MNNNEVGPEDNEFLKKFQSGIDNEASVDERTEEVAEKLDGMNKGPIAKIWDKVVQLWAYVRDPNVHWAKKALPLAGLIYLVSPIDLIPDVIPIAGLVDDVGVIGFVFFRLAAVLGVVGVAAAIIKVAVLTADMIDAWIQKMKKKHLDASYVEIVKLLREKLEEKDYVTCKILGSDNQELESQTWEYDQLDPVLKKEFLGKQKIRIAV